MIGWIIVAVFLSCCLWPIWFKLYLYLRLRHQYFRYVRFGEKPKRKLNNEFYSKYGVTVNWPRR